MKEFNSKKLTFGFGAVKPGTRVSENRPLLYATSTSGIFRMTGAVSSFLKISAGENVMFISNIQEIDNAIAAKNPDLVEFATAQGLDIDSVEAAVAIHKEFDMWLIAKGIAEYDSKGNAKMRRIRMTEEDKVAKLNEPETFTAMLDGCMKNGSEELISSLSRDGITKEEQIQLMLPFCVSPEVPSFTGSKTANANNSTGVGLTLSFTDSNVWNQVKADMGEDAKQKNRIFELDLENAQELTLHDGVKNVSVTAIPLGSFVDKESSRIEKKDSDKEAAE